MDKSYLIHNIKISDNPETKHKTIDVGFSNLTFNDSPSLAADVTLTIYETGEEPVKYEFSDVNLTAAEAVSVQLYDVTLTNNRTTAISITRAVAILTDETAGDYFGNTFSVAPGETFRTKVPIMVGGFTRWVVPSGATFEGDVVTTPSSSSIRADFTGSGTITWS